MSSHSCMVTCRHYWSLVVQVSLIYNALCDSFSSTSGRRPPIICPASASSPLSRLMSLVGPCDSEGSCRLLRRRLGLGLLLRAGSAVRSRVQVSRLNIDRVSSLAVSVSEGEEEFVQRPSGPQDENQEDGLWTFERLDFSQKLDDSRDTQRLRRGTRGSWRNRTRLRSAPEARESETRHALCSLGDTHDQSNEEEEDRDTDLHVEGLEQRELDARVGGCEQAGRAADDDEEEDRENDNGDGLEDIACQEQGRGCLDWSALGQQAALGSATYPESEVCRFGVENLSSCCSGCRVLSKNLDESCG